jgi:hypothetical protein
LFTTGEFSKITTLRALRYYHEQGVLMPSREVYAKLSGMVFQGHPGKYLTEIQILIHV